MSETIRGRLTVHKGKVLIIFPTKKGESQPTRIPWGQLAPELGAVLPDLLDKCEVDLELVGGQPHHIRPIGKAWVGSQPVHELRTEAPPTDASQDRGTPSNTARCLTTERFPSPTLPGAFHNPYNFIPLLPREEVGGELDDRWPHGHDRYHDDCWSGRIAVTLTVVTPLLLPDAAQVSEDDEHKTFPVRVAADGRPYLAPTAVKGMLRAAYEAITNSRFGVFQRHERRLAYRRKISALPARVEQNEHGELVLRVMKAKVVGFAAKLPRYQKHGRVLPKDKGESCRGVAVRYPDNRLPGHGDHVWVRCNTTDTVREIVRWQSITPPGGEWRSGWVCVTGPNINGKQYERVFLESPDDRRILVTDRERGLWRELILDYRETHTRDLAKRERDHHRPGDYLGDEPGKTGWSQHVFTEGSEHLTNGTLCYVELDERDTVTGLYPVTISRSLYAASPQELLDLSLRPASSLKTLSPADRVFGWVNGTGNGAHRGQLRVGPVACTQTGEQAIEPFGKSGLPLAILGQPKPQQARFYVGNARGNAQEVGRAKEEVGYAAGKQLRGRKVYPHHAGLPSAYWATPLDDRTQTPMQGHFQEYRRPQLCGEEQRDTQNRSIEGWVRPGITFSFDLHVTNLSDVELGALLWLLSLDRDAFLRLGSGKPLGFGSVTLAIDWHNTDLRAGRAWAEAYRQMNAAPSTDQTAIIPDKPAAERLIALFHSEATRVFGQESGRSVATDFEHLPFIAAFLIAARGFSDGLPIHYPRARDAGQQGSVPPNPTGESFKWFVENERAGKEGGQRLSLPDLTTDTGLPILESRGKRR